MGEQADIYERITARIIEQMETASAAGSGSSRAGPLAGAAKAARNRSEGAAG